MIWWRSIKRIPSSPKIQNQSSLQNEWDFIDKPMHIIQIELKHWCKACFLQCPQTMLRILFSWCNEDEERKASPPSHAFDCDHCAVFRQVSVYVCWLGSAATVEYPATHSNVTVCSYVVSVTVLVEWSLSSGDLQSTSETYVYFPFNSIQQCSHFWASSSDRIPIITPSLSLFGWSMERCGAGHSSPLVFKAFDSMSTCIYIPKV